MEEAIQNLEFEFKRLCNDLEFISHRHEAEMAKSNFPDVVALIRNIHELSNKIDTIKEKCSAVVEERQQVVTDAVNLLLMNHNSITNTTKNLDGCVDYIKSNDSSSYGDDIVTDHQQSKIELVSAVSNTHFINKASISEAATSGEVDSVTAKKVTISAVKNSKRNAGSRTVCTSATNENNKPLHRNHNSNSSNNVKMTKRTTINDSNVLSSRSNSVY